MGVAAVGVKTVEEMEAREAVLMVEVATGMATAEVKAEAVKEATGVEWAVEAAWRVA